MSIITINFTDKNKDRFNVKIAVENGRLSITGRQRNQDGRIESVGQVYDNIDPANKYQDALVKFWKRWHLNDLRAACEHQRRLGWTYTTHPGKRCPVCGYRLGDSWHIEELPPKIDKAIEMFAERINIIPQDEQGNQKIKKSIWDDPNSNIGRLFGV